MKEEGPAGWASHHHGSSGRGRSKELLARVIGSADGDDADDDDEEEEGMDVVLQRKEEEEDDDSKCVYVLFRLLFLSLDHS